jgi:hypothetical protein
MELPSVGIGPSGLKHGDPFTVYGNIDKLALEKVSPSLESHSEPATGITNTVAGVDTEFSPLTQKNFGALQRNGECG